MAPSSGLEAESCCFASRTTAPVPSNCTIKGVLQRNMHSLSETNRRTLLLGGASVLVKLAGINGAI